MCQICDTNAELYGEIVPDWFVSRAITDGHETGHILVDAGDWFIARRNTGMATFSWDDEYEAEYGGEEYRGFDGVKPVRIT